jgi:hypothetical protein
MKWGPTRRVVASNLVCCVFCHLSVVGCRLSGVGFDCCTNVGSFSFLDVKCRLQNADFIVAGSWLSNVGCLRCCLLIVCAWSVVAPFSLVGAQLCSLPMRYLAML